MGSGYAEFNDATSKIRGMMVAGKGTFSGTFSADNVNAISHINVRDGAVSAHLGFNFPSSARSAAFTVPAQVETSVADIIIPISVWGEGSSPGSAATVNLYKNGALLASAGIALPLPSRINPRDMPIVLPFAGFLQTVRLVDPEVSGVTHYHVEIFDVRFHYYAAAQKVNGGVFLKLSGPITVGFRKR